MRRTARVLSAAALAGATVGITAGAALADPAAEVSPSTVRPGGSVTVSVTCDTAGGQAPATLDASSQAFDEGTVQLQRVPGNDDETSGAAYRGTARIAPAADFEADGPNAVTRDSAWTVDGTCPAAPGGQDKAGKAWSATFQVDRAGGGDGRPCAEPRTDPCGGDGRQCAEARTEPRTEPCDAAVIQRGVRAGEGGTFTDSVPALVGGGVLIAGALGAAAHRLRRRGFTTDG
ncbi:hypothetical protein [Streptomyces cylindrosporus]|uniref:Secreted protein n=1 Tax=Streptomyces cylindrosporus TaxID=2927583 RepID=A0ABS9Y1S3_9ACTN|nr:hypothetical protein [Streptomyces cylindrosporus]MCI3271157.1 hypothetical protein [Streptomyces cylindrosporus]